MPLSYYKKNNTTIPSMIDFFPKKNFFVFIFIFLISSFIVFSISHVLIVNQEREKLNDYANEIFSRADKTSFQIYKTFELIEELGDTRCDNDFIDEVKEILSHHHLIEDAGKIVGNKIMCAAKMGVFEPPKEIEFKVSSVSSIKNVRVLITNRGLFFSGEWRAVLNYKEIFLTLVPTIYIGIDSPDENSGAFFKNIDSGKVLRVFHNLDKNMASEIYAKADNNFYYFPAPDQVLKVEVCSETYRFCIDAIDYKLGVYDIPLDIVFLLLFIALIIAYSIHVSFYHMKNIKGSIKYRLGYAIEHHKIYPLYQPKIDLKTGDIVGVEALARWQDEKLGPVSPDVFIALAEEMQVIKQITKQVTKIVLEESKDLLLADQNFTVSINLSVQDLLDSNYLDYIEQEVEKHGVNRNQIILEITERSATENEGLSNSAHDFYEKGYQISLDDFGTGFCNLAWLSKLESNEIKIDRMFTHSISSNSVGLITLDGICQLLENFHMKTVFEGIETEEELAYILTKSPDAIGQGWLFAKAMPMAEVKSLIASKVSKGNKD